ncbi:RNA-directed DNA polymerase, eukaryota, reverse transcriptase zinc-binding domain protein [Tanacetum coccineum]|uniref:RNA-directed DNA polymerase, eukaryota, reverse transcriptase zinc-binding domain protein n=1 Tax=Tanacetum coccineum TaxID=301880 RepID=A0ABQ4X2C5_9ASTR
MLDPHNHHLRIHEAKLVEEFYEAKADEEKLLYQQAKIKWMSEGDKNSKYFYSVLKCRIRTKHQVQDIESIDSLIKDKLSVGDAELMIREVSDKEIKDALFDIDDSKSLGPDGFSAAFFKKSWSVIGANICKAVMEFFKSGKMLGPLPVVMCFTNVSVKFLLTELSLFLVSLKGGPKRVAFKIDIQKAYDTVNWEFLEKILGGFGFHGLMIKWIMQCVTTDAFTLNINGERIGYFKGGRGLRHGDPISPYLFTMIMEIFSLILLREIEREPQFQYHFGCKSIKLSHVCFVDDLLVMCHGDLISVKVIKKALDSFSAYSGLIPNNSESIVFYGSMNEEEKNAICSVLPFAIRNMSVRYLGVLLIDKRLGVKECGCLLDKIKNRIRNWKNKYLSYAGRLQLIDVVLESIHVYWASVFLLPATIIKEINRILKNFLWNQSENSASKAKVAWSSICRPKDQGGLGLKSLHIWNQALLTKHVWNIATKKDSLWVKWVHYVKLRGKNESLKEVIFCLSTADVLLGLAKDALELTSAGLRIMSPSLDVNACYALLDDATSSSSKVYLEGRSLEM